MGITRGAFIDGVSLRARARINAGKPWILQVGVIVFHSVLSRITVRENAAYAKPE